MNATLSDPMTWFPYRPRPNQDLAVIHAARVYAGNTVGLLSADCGVGKTIAVLSGYFAARAGSHGSRLVVLTRTHSQSEVFESELAEIRRHSAASTSQSNLTVTSMVSRSHVCPVRAALEGTSTMGFLRACNAHIKSGRCTHFWNFYTHSGGDEGPLQLRDRARRLVEQRLRDGIVTRQVAEADSDQFCPYEILRHCARQSRVIIGPYNYMFKERVRDALLSTLGVQLHEIDLLVDEAHNLPTHILDAESARMTGDDIEQLRRERNVLVRETGMDWIAEVIEFLWESMMTYIDDVRQGSERRLEKWEAVPRFIDEQQLVSLLNRTTPIDTDVAVPTETPLDRLAEFLYTAMMASRDDDWHASLTVRRTGGTGVTLSDVEITIRPLNSAGLAAPILRGVRAALLMSGTLRPLTYYASLLGVSNALIQDLASPYVHGSRLVLIDRDVTTGYTGRNPELWRTLADRVSTVLTTSPAQKSALVAFPSYQIMTDVLSHDIQTGYRERIVESKSQRIEDLREALEDHPCVVFMVYGGKFSEGVDLVKDGHSMVDLIIGVGVPFTPPTSYQRALQEYYDRRFGRGCGYYYTTVVPSIRSVVQLVGRLRRSPEDCGVVVLLDSRFLRHLEMFGPDFTTDVWPYSGRDELVMALRMYYGQYGGVRR